MVYVCGGGGSVGGGWLRAFEQFPPRVSGGSTMAFMQFTSRGSGGSGRTLAWFALSRVMLEALGHYADRLCKHWLHDQVCSTSRMNELQVANHQFLSSLLQSGF